MSGSTPGGVLAAGPDRADCHHARPVPPPRGAWPPASPSAADDLRRTAESVTELPGMVGRTADAVSDVPGVLAACWWPSRRWSPCGPRSRRWSPSIERIGRRVGRAGAPRWRKSPSVAAVETLGPVRARVDESDGRGVGPPPVVDRIAADVARLSEVPAQLGALHEELRPLRTLGDLPARIEAMQAELEALGGAVGAMAADLSATRQEVAPMDEDLGRVEAAVLKMEPALQEMKGELAGLRQDLSGLPFVGN